MVMWFYDEAGEMEDFQDFRKKARGVEKEYLEVRVFLQETEAALRANPGNEELKARIRYLTWRLEDLERQFPWICSDLLKELALWGTPHG